MDGSKGGISGASEGVLANFFNSLLKKSSSTTPPPTLQSTGVFPPHFLSSSNSGTHYFVTYVALVISKPVSSTKMRLQNFNEPTCVLSFVMILLHLTSFLGPTQENWV